MRASSPDVQIVDAAQVGRACDSPRPIVSVASGKRMSGEVSRAISRAPLTLGMTVVCTSGVATTSVPPPVVTSVPAVVTAIVTSGGVDARAGSSDVAPVPVLAPKLTSVAERVPAVERSPPPLSEPPDLLPVVEVVPAIDLPSSPLSGRSSLASSQTLAWGDADDSSAPLSPNRVQTGHSQDVPDDCSLFHVSPVSPGFVFRPSRIDQQPPSEGVLLPTTLDDFDDSVLCDPITYARCEQFPLSESPMSLLVYAWPSGSAYLLEQSLLQTVLASGASCRRSTHGSGGRPVVGDGPAGLSVLVLGVRWTAVFGWESSVWLTASSPTAPRVRRSIGVGSTVRLFTNVLGGPARQGTSYGSRHQPTAGCGHYVVQS